jgi:HEAT repeat protein
MLYHLDHYRIKNPRYGPFAEKILRTSPKNDFRKKAASILGWIGGKKAKKALNDALNDEDPLVRAFAARSLKGIQLDSASNLEK